jgi:glycosyltransferase involved in cell wall biosynthesis
MRIIQLIDSLEAGGAERMAVNYANELSEKIEFSGLVASRQQGQLLNQLNKNVNYLFLNKKSSLDLKSILLLKKFIKHNKVNFIHAHSTSFFLAFLIKLFIPNLKLIWHDHYGDSEFLEARPIKILKFVMKFYDGIIVVNQKLKNWNEIKLNFKNVIYLPNFPTLEINVNEKTRLNGFDNKRIICLANLREQKNHFLLIKVAERLKKTHSEWSFHLVGKDFNDHYSSVIKNLVSEKMLSNNVFIYGSKQDITNILEQSEIAVLTSSSEGLPLALLEYGLNKKPVVVTSVGEITAIINNNINGFMVSPDDENGFYDCILKLINDKILANKMAKLLNDLVLLTYSKNAVILNYLNWISLKNG